MEVVDAISLLEKYGMYDDAKNECRLKKIDRAPYDMQGHHEIYCNYLSKKCAELRKKKSELIQIKCVEWDNIPDNLKPAHDDCCFVGVNCTKDYCRTMCRYYQDNIKIIDQELEELYEAQKVLKEAANEDYYLK